MKLQRSIAIGGLILLATGCANRSQPTYESQTIYQPGYTTTTVYGTPTTTATVYESAPPVSASVVVAPEGGVYYGGPAYYGEPCCGSNSESAKVSGTYGNVTTSGKETWYDNSSGTMGEKYSGSYSNAATGTTGTIKANESYNPYTGVSQDSTNRTFNTTSGTTGDVQRDASYNDETGQGSYGVDRSATGAGGSSVSTDKQVNTAPGQMPQVSRDATVDNANTGETKSYGGGSAYDSRAGDVGGFGGGDRSGGGFGGGGGDFGGGGDRFGGRR